MRLSSFKVHLIRNVMPHERGVEIKIYAKLDDENSDFQEAFQMAIPTIRKDLSKSIFCIDAKSSQFSENKFSAFTAKCFFKSRADNEEDAAIQVRLFGPHDQFEILHHDVLRGSGLTLDFEAPKVTAIKITNELVYFEIPLIRYQLRLM